MKMESKDLHEGDIEKIENIFPEAITEIEDPTTGRIERKIDFDKLKECISGSCVEGIKERYEFTWPGKKQAKIEAFTPIKKTLRPCKDESTNWDTTKNIYIKGDNLEALKLLQESYLERIKLIYIDPPYNTGEDFIYKDDYSTQRNQYERMSDAVNDCGYRMYKNTQSDGRFHSNWCSMIYPRLLLSRNLLRDDGIICISMNDSEIKNLKYICDEIFGESNFISQLIWQNKKGGGNDSTYVAIEHEYILIYAKNISMLHEFYQSYSEEYLARYKESDDVGRYYWDTYKRKSGKQYYAIKCPDGSFLEKDADGNPISWLRSENRFYQDIKDGEVRIVKNNDKWSVQFKQRMPKGKKPRSIFTTETIVSEKGTTSSGSSDVYKYFKKNVFSNPKPVDLIKHLLSFCTGSDDIIMDFFSGSATTCEAVFSSNMEDAGHRRFIAVQISEKIECTNKETNSDLISKNAIAVLDEIKKPHLITELALERIRRAGAEYKKAIDGQDLDVGFRIFYVDTTNMEDVYYSSKEYKQETLNGLVNNIKNGRTPDDLLAAIMIEWGLELSLPYESMALGNNTVYSVDHNMLIACFDADISETTVRSISKMKPTYVVFRDSSFKNVQDKINLGELFKNESPETVIKVL